MNLPEPPETGIPKRIRNWLMELRKAILSAQPVAGRFATIDVHPGKGTVINAGSSEERGRPSGGGGGGPGACCVGGSCSITTEAECSGNYLGDGSDCLGVDCTQGACCYMDGTTPACFVDAESTCEGFGIYQGDGTTCEDADCGSQFSGACCVDTNCTIKTLSECITAGGTYQGDDTTCSPNPCEALPPCDPDGCGPFFNPADGRSYNALTWINSVDNSNCPPDGFCEPSYPEGCPDPGCNSPYGCDQVFTVKIKHVEANTGYDPDTCEFTTETLEVLASCSHAVNIDGTGCDLSCDGPVGGTNGCLTLNPDDDPAFFTVCGIVNTTAVYSDPCED
jgi:hypothetical protein